MKYHNCSTFNQDLSENISYNNPAFPAYVRGGRLSLYPDYSASPHWHEDLEFIVVASGSMTYNVNGQLIELTPGNGICINSRQLHHGFSKEHHECDFICILLHPSLLSSNKLFTQNYVEPYLRNMENPYILLDSDIDWTQEILNLLIDLFQNSTKKTAPFLIQRHFFHIFELLYTHGDFHQQLEDSSCDLPTIKDMILFIQEHYQEKITLNDIAKAGSCCKSKCSELFRAFLKESPILYLNKYRLKLSCDELRETDKSITEIALGNGFSGTSYFSEAFHKHYGITPRCYRENLTDNRLSSYSHPNSSSLQPPNT